MTTTVPMVKQTQPLPVAAEPAGGSKAVFGWALAGVLCLLIEVYAFGAWITSDRFTPTPDGATPIPGWMVANARIWEVGSVIASAAFIYLLIIRPWRKDRQVGLDGYLTIAFLTLWWQDPLVNYIQPWVTYSTAFFNMGSWSSDILGWQSPRGHMFAEPILWAAPGYIYIFFGFTLISVGVMRTAKRRWPNLSSVQLMAVVFSFICVLDIVAETLWLRLGMYVYVGVVPELTLFHGRYYQFPLYEVPLFAALFTGFASFRYFRNDKGQTFAERGLEAVRGSATKRTALRFLALTGALNVLFLGLYCVPAMLWGMHAEWSPDVIKRSYFTNQLCGPEANRACPGDNAPIARRGAPYLNYGGQLVVPEVGR